MCRSALASAGREKNDWFRSAGDMEVPVATGANMGYTDGKDKQSEEQI